jgi:hypothetical protein
MNNKTMSCEDFAELLDNNYFFDQLVDEQYWTDGFKADPFFTDLKDEAKKRGIVLSNVDDFDYEKYFQNVYSSSEKGLS